MNRIETLRSLHKQQKEKTPNTEPEEQSNEESPTPLSLTQQRLSTEEKKTTEEIDESTDVFGSSPVTREFLTEPSGQTQRSAKPTRSLSEEKSEKTRAIGKGNTPEGKPLDILRSETESGTLPEFSSENLRKETWKVMMELRAGKIEPKIAREFSRGCNTILQSARLEAKAQGWYGK